MALGKWAGTWAGSGQSLPRSTKPYTKAVVGRIATEHLAAVERLGAGHPTTEAYRESLERAVASYNATHRRPWAPP